jgi:hypothetical protein
VKEDQEILRSLLRGNERADIFLGSLDLQVTSVLCYQYKEDEGDSIHISMRERKDSETKK